MWHDRIWPVPTQIESFSYGCFRYTCVFIHFDISLMWLKMTPQNPLAKNIIVSTTTERFQQLPIMEIASQILKRRLYFARCTAIVWHFHSCLRPLLSLELWTCTCFTIFNTLSTICWKYVGNYEILLVAQHMSQAIFSSSQW